MNNQNTTPKLKDLKRILDKMNDFQLAQPLLYNSEEHSISGKVSSIEKAKENLYYTGEDDPAQLYTMKELKEQYDKEEIENFEIEIPKGSLVIKL